MFRKLTALLAAAVAVLLLSDISFGQDVKDPASEIWENAYAWLQTGQNLEEQEQWALAQGSYIEAHRKLQRVASEYPAFESVLVNYRVESLEEKLKENQEKLETKDHEITVKYLDFIDSMETGVEKRYSRNYKESLDTLEFAMSILEEVIEAEPTEIRSAIDSQYKRLENHILWLSETLNRERRSLQRRTLADTVDWGTTQFVKLSDLPQEEVGEMSPELFPPVSLIQEPVLPKVEGPDGDPVGNGVSGGSEAPASAE